MTDTDPRTGGCQCGAVRYRIAPGKGTVYVCHCTECRKQSASAFGLSLTVERARFTLKRGETATWSRPTDSGNVLHCHFCTACGSRIWHENAPDAPNVTVKAGSLDGPVDLRHAVHIWTTRKLEGVVIPPDAVQYPGEPD